MKRNIFSFFELLFWPFIGILSIGLMGSFLNIGEKYLSFILTGAIFSGVLQVTQLDVSYGLLYEIWAKSVKQIFLAPVYSFDYIIGSWIFGTIRGTIVFVLLTLTSKWIFNFSPPTIEIIIVSLLGVYLNALIIGLIVCTFVISFGQKIDIIAWSLSILAMLICGIYYPVNFLPKTFYTIAQFIPLTYFLEYFRTYYNFKPVFSYILLKGFSLAGIYILVLFYLLNLSQNNARKNGIILRLSE
jgi:ABC-2 type transport system permease protein